MPVTFTEADFAEPVTFTEEDFTEPPVSLEPAAASGMSLDEWQQREKALQDAGVEAGLAGVQGETAGGGLVTPAPTDPLISPQLIESAMRLSAPGLQPLLETPLGSGAVERTAENLAGMTSIHGLTTAPLFLVPGISQGLAGYMGAEALGAGAGEAVEALRQGDPKSLGKGLVNVGMGAAMTAPAILGGRSLAKGRTTEPPPVPEEATPPPRGMPAVPEGAPTPRQAEVAAPPVIEPAPTVQPAATTPTPEAPGLPIEAPPKISAKATEKLPVQVDMEVTADQLKLASDNIDQLLTRGNWTDEIDVKLAKGKPADPRTKINVGIDEQIKSELVAAAKRVEVLRRKASQQADPVTQNLLKLEQEKMKIWLARFQESGRTWHDVGMSRQRMAREMARSSDVLKEMLPNVKQNLPFLDRIWKLLREKDFTQAGREFVDFLRVNLFTPGSWTLDLTSNLGTVASRVPEWLALDAVHFVTGKPAERMASATRALRLSSQNAVPWAERFRLPEKIESEIGTTIGGEFGGQGKEIMVDFSEILKGKPELAKKLKEVDRVLAAPPRMKRAVDHFFGRFGATAELFNDAYSQGRRNGLKGDALKEFVDDYVKNPPADASARSVRVGKEFKYNRDLFNWEERFAASLVTKLGFEAFPRWTLQATRWVGEMIGADPSFWRDVKNRRANHEDVIKYLSRAATGWGGIYAFNQLFYDDIDPNTMERVDEHGNRQRLSGRFPFPELYFITALLRGNTDGAKMALPHLSLPLAKLAGGEPAGLLSPFIDTMRESMKGRYTAEQTARELTKLVNDMIPGKSMLGFIRSFFDPTIREGVGSPIPGVSSLLPQKTSVTTGEPLAPMQRIPGTQIQLPSVGGTPFPGAVRVLNDIEKALLNHGIGLTRPRRTSLIDLPAEDVPKELRREYEQLVGRNVKRILGEGIQDKGWQEAEFEVRRELLTSWLEMARLISRAELADKHGTSMAPVKSVPLNIKRLPVKMKEGPYKP